MNNLDLIPTTEAGLRMLGSIAPQYDESYVMKWLMEVEGLEMEEASQLFRELRLQAFVETATWGIVYWEQAYFITPDPNLSLEARRERIQSKRSRASPINPAVMEKMLEEYTDGNVAAEVLEHLADGVFGISLKMSADYNLNLKGLIDLVNRTKQSHMAVKYWTARQSILDSEVAVFTSSAAAHRHILRADFSASDNHGIAIHAFTAAPLCIWQQLRPEAPEVAFLYIQREIALGDAMRHTHHFGRASECSEVYSNISTSGRTAHQQRYNIPLRNEHFYSDGNSRYLRTAGTNSIYHQMAANTQAHLQAEAHMQFDIRSASKTTHRFSVTKEDSTASVEVYLFPISSSRMSCQLAPDGNDSHASNTIYILPQCFTGRRNFVPTQSAKVLTATAAAASCQCAVRIFHNFGGIENG